MKPILCIFLIFFLNRSSMALAQATAPQLPSFTIVRHFTIAVNFNTTTVLVFPAALNQKPVDRGDRDFIAQRQPGSENVLKLKAARKGFPPTNLHVFSKDGRIYAFDVVYTDSLAATYDLTEFRCPPDSLVLTHPIVQLSDQPITSTQLDQAENLLKTLPRKRRSGPVQRQNQMTFRLQAVGQLGSLLMLRLSITNRSNLDYRLDFMRLYIKDRQKARRTSVQEREIPPVYQDTSSYVPGGATITHILAVPAFTLAGGKEAILEAYEKDGGRTLKISLHNSTLFRAIDLSK